MSENTNNDLSILAPDADVRLSSGTVTVRKYGFLEGLKLNAVAAPLVKAMADIFQDADLDSENPEDIPLDELGVIFGNHAKAVTELIAISIDKEPEWVEALNDLEGQTLMMAWWSVNCDFFICRLVRMMGASQARQDRQREKAVQSHGETASPA